MTPPIIIIMRAQSAFEYLIIISIVISFLVPIWAYVLGTQQRTTDELSLSYANNAVSRIVDTSNLVYSQGPPAKVTVSIYIPAGVQEFIVLNNTLVMRMRTGSGFSDVYDTSIATINMTENLNDTLTEEGNYLLKIEAYDNVVQISR